MAQRIVIWKHPHNAPLKPGASFSIDLDPDKLADELPDLAEDLNGGRIISHTMHVVTGQNGPDWIMTFVVDND